MTTTPTAGDIRAALTGRFPAEKCLLIEEAPEDSGRQGRKIDVLALNFWRSQGLSVDAIEIKVSTGDLRKELADPTKAQFWWEHSDRFWLATTTKVWDLARDEVPDTWGVLTLTDAGKMRVQRKAPKTPRTPWPWSTTVGVLRACVGVSTGMLQSEWQKGRSAGIEEGKRRQARGSGDSQLVTELDRLKKTVAEFEAAAGLRLHEWNAGDIGQIVKMIESTRVQELSLNTLDRTADRLNAHAEALRAMATEVRSVNAGDLVCFEDRVMGEGPADEFDDRVMERSS